MQTLASGKLKKTSNRHAPEVSRQTGFPSPATHYAEPGIDLHKELITHPDATFFVRVDGDQWAAWDICHQDVLIIDRSLEPKNNRLALVVTDGEFDICRFPPKNRETDCMLWGVITYIIHPAK